MNIEYKEQVRQDLIKSFESSGMTKKEAEIAAEEEFPCYVIVSKNGLFQYAGMQRNLKAVNFHYPANKYTVRIWECLGTERPTSEQLAEIKAYRKGLR